MKHSVQVTILGQQYHVRSDLPPVEVRRVADFVNEKMAEVADGQKVADTLNAAVLALMNVAAAYLQADGGHRQETEDERRLNRLLDRLEAACPVSAAAPKGGRRPRR